MERLIFLCKKIKHIFEAVSDASRADDTNSVAPADNTDDNDITDDAAAVIGAYTDNSNAAPAAKGMSSIDVDTITTKFAASTLNDESQKGVDDAAALLSIDAFTTGATFEDCVRIEWKWIVEDVLVKANELITRRMDDSEPVISGHNDNSNAARERRTIPMAAEKKDKYFSF